MGGSRRILAAMVLSILLLDLATCCLIIESFQDVICIDVVLHQEKQLGRPRYYIMGLANGTSR